MKLGFVSDSLGGMAFADMMDNAERMGVSGIEVNTCGWSTAPHCRMDDLLNSFEGLEKSVDLLKGVMPSAPADFKPQEI